MEEILREKLLVRIGSGFYSTNRGMANRAVSWLGEEVFEGSTRSEFGLKAFSRIVYDHTVGVLGEVEIGFGPGLSSRIRQALGINEKWRDCSVKSAKSVGCGLVCTLVKNRLFFYLVNGYKGSECVCNADHSGMYVKYGLMLDLGRQTVDLSLINFNGDQTIKTRGSNGMAGFTRWGMGIGFARSWSLV